MSDHCIISSMDGDIKDRLPPDFPVEIWGSIIGFATDLDSSSFRTRTFGEHLLPPHSRESLKAKLRISLVSKSFRTVTAQYLYEAVVLRNEDEIVNYATQSPHKHEVSKYTTMLKFDLVYQECFVACQLNFARPILERCRNIQALLLHSRGRFEDAPMSFLPPSICESLASHVPAGLDYFSVFYSHSDETACNALMQFVSVLLGRCKALRVLELPGLSSFHPIRFHGPTSREHPCLTHLSAPSYDQFVLCSDFVAPVLRHVVFQRWDIDLALNSISRSPSIACNTVVSMEIKVGFSLNYTGVEHFSRLFPNLRSLSYLFVGDSFDFHNNLQDHYNVHVLSHTLEHIVVDVGDYYDSCRRQIPINSNLIRAGYDVDGLQYKTDVLLATWSSVQVYDRRLCPSLKTLTMRCSIDVEDKVRNAFMKQVGDRQRRDTEETASALMHSCMPHGDDQEGIQVRVHWSD